MSETGTGTKRSLTFQDGSSNKFWTIELNDDSHTVHFGRVGTQGQAQTKSFGSAAEAKKSFDKLVAEKIKKGYVDEDGAAPAAMPTPTAKTAKPKSKKSAADSEEATPAEEMATATATPTKAAAAATPVPSRSAPPTFSTSVTRQIDLEPTDWYAASFHPRPTLTRSAPREFDIEACLKILSKGKTDNWGWDTKWVEMKLPDTLSREEAHFWLVAMTTERGRDTELKDFAVKFARKHGRDTFDGQVDLSAALKSIHAFRRLSPEIVLPLANLFTPEELVDAWLTQPGEEKDEDVEQFATGFDRYVKPYLTAEQKTALQRIIEQHAEDFKPTAPNENFSLTVYWPPRLACTNRSLIL